MVGRFKDPSKDKQQLEEMNVRTFYKDNYSIRLLNVDHLRKEITHCLTKKVENKDITPELYLSYKEKVEENLDLLILDG